MKKLTKKEQQEEKDCMNSIARIIKSIGLCNRWHNQKMKLIDKFSTKSRNNMMAIIVMFFIVTCIPGGYSIVRTINFGGLATLVAGEAFRSFRFNRRLRSIDKKVYGELLDTKDYE